MMNFKNFLTISILTSVTLAVAAPQAGELKPGDKAPEFSATGSDGKVYKSSVFTREHRVIVLEWFNKDCPYVHKFYDSKTMQGLQEKAVADKVVWLTIASSAEGKEGHLDANEAAKVRTEKGMNSTALLLDGKGTIARAYGAKTTPHMFIIDKKGRIAYAGALDDRPSALPKSLDGAENYVTEALTSLAKGEPVKTPSTAPYGCGVKY